MNTRSPHTAMVAHHLRLMGVRATEVVEKPHRHVMVVTAATFRQLLRNRDIPLARVMVVLDDDDSDLVECGIRAAHHRPGPQHVHFVELRESAWASPRTLHGLRTYECEHPHDVVATTPAGEPCWLSLRLHNSVVLLIGTDLGGDLIRYRQGDPARVSHRTDQPMWGIAGERPFYLFETQIEPGAESARHADWWAMALAETVSASLREPVPPVLPRHAPGAVVITGDDDQAFLEKYDEQLSRLDGLKVTYFLHPQTRHTRATMAALERNYSLEWGLHPDALDRPSEYAQVFREQAEWFQRVTGKGPKSVRNHGYLNDGYWGHVPTWLDHGVRISANLPGVNGRILNGSLLPARFAWEDRLTQHWSILTAIGDGVRFALGMDGPQSAQCILDLSEQIVNSKLPGVIVVNLHPQNVSETVEMHEAVRELVERHGFPSLSLATCIRWFSMRDRVLDGHAAGG